VPDEAWLVNPTSGAVSPDPNPSSTWVVNPIIIAVSADPGPTGTLLNAYRVSLGSVIGRDSHGRPVIMESNFQPGSAYTVFVGDAEERRIVIYSGHMGDAMGFDPTWMVADGDALWGANRQATAIWRWTEAGGLKKYSLHGAAQHGESVIAQVAGPCLNGQ
jgi:hypothetical protein